MNHDRIHSFAGFSNAWFHRNGGMGVDVFFALSGLLICTRLLAEERSTQSISLRKFYIRRLFRIQPAALLYLSSIALLMLTGVLDHAFDGILYSLLLVRNYLPLEFRPTDWYTGHFWSLSVEEHFYLILPGALLLFKKHRLKCLLGLTVFLKVWEGVVHRYKALQFGWTWRFHTDVALIGILLAVQMAVLLTRPGVSDWTRKWLNPYVILFLAMTFCYGASVSHNPLIDLTKKCLFPLLIVSTMQHPETIIGRILELPPVRFLGRVSYGVYLWQSLFFVNSYPVPTPHSVVLATIQTSWLRYPATAAVVLVSYYLVEKPLIRVGHRLAKSSTRLTLPASGFPLPQSPQRLVE
jgi:peptidoglycan/LPS O-acetylase OafA/YrhL